MGKKDIIVEIVRRFNGGNVEFMKEGIGEEFKLKGVLLNVRLG